MNTAQQALLLACLALFTTEVASSNSACAVPANRTCNPGILDCCDNQFATALNLTKCNGNFFERAKCYRDEIESMYGQGADGGLTVCAAYSYWAKCLGKSLLDCQSIKYHVMQGLTSAEAKYIYTTYAQMQYLCGPGLDTFVNHDTCIKNVFVSYKDQLKRCREIFSNNLQNNYMNHCRDFSELLGCVQLPFQKLCGLEGGWWGCEYQRSGVVPWLPDCPEQCVATNNDIREKPSNSK